jgi:hypothetical protein
MLHTIRIYNEISGRTVAQITLIYAVVYMKEIHEKGDKQKIIKYGQTSARQMGTSGLCVNTWNQSIWLNLTQFDPIWPRWFIKGADPLWFGPIRDVRKIFCIYKGAEISGSYLAQFWELRAVILTRESWHVTHHWTLWNKRCNVLSLQTKLKKNWLILHRAPKKYVISIRAQMKTWTKMD